MEVLFSTQNLLLALGAVILVSAGLVLGFRYYFRHLDRHRLRHLHADDRQRSLLAGRNKYAEVDVFRWSGVFLRFGLMASLVLILAALNWSEESRPTSIPEGAMDFSEDIEVEIPRSAEPPPPPPPPPPPVIQEVPDDLLEAEDQPEFVDQSIERQTEVIAPPPAAPGPKTPPPPPPPPPKEEEIFVIAEDMPRFPGCEELPTKKEKEECARSKLLEFVYANISYPPEARENGVEGTVVVSFVVEKDGSVTDIRLVRDIGGGTGDETVRVVRKMNDLPSRWTPGKQRGKPVRVQFNLPVKFVLK